MGKNDLELISRRPPTIDIEPSPPKAITPVNGNKTVVHPFMSAPKNIYNILDVIFNGFIFEASV